MGAVNNPLLQPLRFSLEKLSIPEEGTTHTALRWEGLVYQTGYRKICYQTLPFRFFPSSPPPPPPPPPRERKESGLATAYARLPFMMMLVKHSAVLVASLH